jgi:hypothetical protein
MIRSSKRTVGGGRRQGGAAPSESNSELAAASTQCNAYCEPDQQVHSEVVHAWHTANATEPGAPPDWWVQVAAALGYGEIIRWRRTTGASPRRPAAGSARPGGPPLGGLAGVVSAASPHPRASEPHAETSERPSARRTGQLLMRCASVQRHTSAVPMHVWRETTSRERLDASR